MRPFCSICAALVALTLLVSLPGCDNSLVNIDANELAGANLTQGIHRREISLGDGHTLRYTVSVPSLTFGKKYPLVVALHHAPEVIRPWLSETFLRSVAEPGLRDLNAIIFAPDMPDNAPSWVDNYTDEMISELVRKMLKLERSWPVDPNRVVIVGYSAGGFGVWSLTDRYPNLFSAGIPMAAEPILGDREGPNAVPLYYIHGDQDELFTYEIAVFGYNLLKERGVPITLVTAEGQTHTTMTAYVPYLKTAVPWLMEEIW